MPGMSMARILNLAKGYRGRSKNCTTIARNAVERGLRHAQRNRKIKHRNFRQSWIHSINAGARDIGTNYSYLMYGLKNQDIQLNRRMLGMLAQTEPLTFKAITRHVVKETQNTPGFRPLPVIRDHRDFGLSVSNIVAETVPAGKIPFKRKARRAVANFY